MNEDTGASVGQLMQQESSIPGEDDARWRELLDDISVSDDDQTTPRTPRTPRTPASAHPDQISPRPRRVKTAAQKLAKESAAATSSPNPDPNVSSLAPGSVVGTPLPGSLTNPSFDQHQKELRQAVHELARNRIVSDVYSIEPVTIVTDNPAMTPPLQDGEGDDDGKTTRVEPTTDGANKEPPLASLADRFPQMAPQSMATTSSGDDFFNHLGSDTPTPASLHPSSEPHIVTTLHGMFPSHGVNDFDVSFRAGFSTNRMNSKKEEAEAHDRIAPIQEGGGDDAPSLSNMFADAPDVDFMSGMTSGPSYPSGGGDTSFFDTIGQQQPQQEQQQQGEWSPEQLAAYYTSQGYYQAQDGSWYDPRQYYTEEQLQQYYAQYQTGSEQATYQPDPVYSSNYQVPPPDPSPPNPSYSSASIPPTSFFQPTTDTTSGLNPLGATPTPMIAHPPPPTSSYTTPSPASSHPPPSLFNPASMIQSVAAASTSLPSTTQEALRNPNGRPPCPLVSFGFGGVICHLSPVVMADGRATTAPMQITTLRQYMLTKLRQQYGAMYDQGATTTSSQGGGGSFPLDPMGAAAAPMDTVASTTHHAPNSHDASSLLSAADAFLLKSVGGPVRDALLPLLTLPGPLGSTPLAPPRLKALVDLITERTESAVGDDAALWAVLKWMLQSSSPPMTTRSSSSTSLLSFASSHHQAAAPSPTTPLSSHAASLAHLLGVSASSSSSSSWNQPSLLVHPPPPHPSHAELEAAAHDLHARYLSGDMVEAVRIAARARMWGLAWLLIRQVCVVDAVRGAALQQEVAYTMSLEAFPSGSPMHVLCWALGGVSDWDYHPGSEEEAHVTPSEGSKGAMRIGLGAVKSLFTRQSKEGHESGKETSRAHEASSDTSSMLGPLGGSVGSLAPPPAPPSLGGSSRVHSVATLASIDPASPSILGTLAMTKWRDVACTLVATRSDASLALLRQLGEKLLQHGNTPAAHACLLLANSFLPACYSSQQRSTCLVASDHASHPRTFASCDALFRTELVEHLLLTQQATALSTQTMHAAVLAFQPFKLVLAHLLAEIGAPSMALRYCETMQATLKQLLTGPHGGNMHASQGGGGGAVKVPPGLLIYRDYLTELEHRLRVQCGNVSAPSGSNASASIVGSLGKWLDKGINKLIGIEGASGDGEGGVPLGSTGGGGVGNERGTHQRVGSADAYAPPQPVDAADNRSSRSHPVSPPNRSRDASAEPSQGGHSRRAGASLGGIFSSINLQGILAPLRPGTGKEMKLGQQSKFYYDEKLGMWREEGVELPPDAGPLAPPPTNLGGGWMPPGGMGGGSGAPPPPPTASAPPPSGMPPVVGGGRTVRSKYVDTFSHGGGAGGGGAGSATAPPPTAPLPPLAPKPIAGLVPLAPRPAPAAPFMPPPSAAFFVPTGGAAEMTPPPPSVQEPVPPSLAVPAPLPPSGEAALNPLGPLFAAPYTPDDVLPLSSDADVSNVAAPYVPTFSPSLMQQQLQPTLGTPNTRNRAPVVAQHVASAPRVATHVASKQANPLDGANGSTHDDLRDVQL